MFEIMMPQADKTMSDGTVVRWAKSEGDAVREGEVLLEVETETARVEVESAHGGTLLKIVVPAGTTASVHALLALLGDPREDVGAAVARAIAGQAEQAPAAPAAPEEAKAAPSKAATPAAAPGGKVTPVLMPQAGNTMEEGTITKWVAQVGDAIKEGDVIFEVETDKANVEVEATDAGRLARIVADVGDTVEVLKPVAYLADSDTDVDAYIASAPELAAAPAAAVQPAVAAPVAAAPTAASVPAPAVTAGGRVKASPAARKLAAERGVDPAAVGTGSGPGGRILSDDVPAAPGKAAAAASAAPPVPVGAAATGQVVRHPMSKMRRAIARNLLASKQTIPHFYARMTIDAAAMFSFYRGEKAKYPCTLNDVVVLACARVMQEFPPVRSRIKGDEIIESPTSNVGIAVGLDEGLVVPVVVAAERMDLRRFAERSARTVEAARGGKIEGMGQGNFTITNLGMFGVEEFAAIINPPEAAILAVGAIREEVIVTGGAMRAGKVMTLTLSADHRVIDGVTGAKFLGRLKEVLESPQQLA